MSLRLLPSNQEHQIKRFREAGLANLPGSRLRDEQVLVLHRSPEDSSCMPLRGESPPLRGRSARENFTASLTHPEPRSSFALHSGLRARREWRDARGDEGLSRSGGGLTLTESEGGCPCSGARGLSWVPALSHHTERGVNSAESSRYGFPAQADVQSEQRRRYIDVRTN